ncbi:MULTISPECIES: glycosyltransferase family 4 protein [Enterococcus]|uniref:glycosyltransferase family 4 protein n=1 Tax=Enterococcus TaxID=1350 RepID=UPI0010C220C7|nr:MULTISPECIES: glycosyltransferase family 4 protein [Enterococcus]EMF0481152.1 glycosyltransferase family 4 protein [Enterococcus faecium]MEB8410887.1 glycosyltransferase family 4 protein [Enterococcus faecium]TKN97607.1 glycosyltransferase family 1 protein [Enterococcus faecium]WEL46379.1 glycosyltransferase family 4 protein [Enterococcus casseliflavus]
MIFVANWDKNKKKTWSGTTYSLKESLEKTNQIKNIEVHQSSKLNKIIFGAYSFIKYGEFEKNMNFNWPFLNKVSKNINREIKDNKAEEFILQIGDLAEIEDSYIYQDLSVGFLLHVRKNDPEAFKYSNFQDIPIAKLEKRDQIQKKRYEKAKGILTMSKTLEDFLVNVEQIPAEKVFHVGGGINLPLPLTVRKKNRRRILFVGRDFERKGGPVLVQAFKKLKNDIFDELELYIAGPKHLNGYELDSNIIFLGDLSQEDLKYYFEICDIFCMPSKFEAYGLVFIEALSFGLPCIGTNKFEMRHFIQNGENGYLLEEPDSAEELSNKIQQLLTNEEIFSKVRQEAVKYHEEYSWENVSKKINQISMFNNKP